MLIYMNFLFSLLFVLLSLAFMTLMERKLLGNFHFRLGPDKVGFYGLLQPISDALKLFSKDSFNLKKFQKFLLDLSPVSLIMILMSLIILIPLKSNLIMSNNSMMIFVLLISLSLFPFLLSGIMSFSKYGIMGSYRCVIQMISYEIMISYLFIVLMIVSNSMNYNTINLMNSYFSGFMKFNFLFLLVLFLFEMGRTPFDFIEGESELVSGFNTEFWGPYFSMFFIYEYGMLVILSSLIAIMVFFYVKMIMMFLVLIMMVIIRASFPRYRYDLMISFMWKHMFFLFSLFLLSIYMVM